MNKQFEEYMNSLCGGFNPVLNASELSKINERNAKVANEVGKTFMDSLKSIGNLAQENFKLSMEAAQKLDITNPNSFAVSDKMKELMDRNQQIVAETQKLQTQVAEDVKKCASENWKDLTGGACCSKGKKSS